VQNCTSSSLLSSPVLYIGSSRQGSVQIARNYFYTTHNYWIKNITVCTSKHSIQYWKLVWRTIYNNLKQLPSSALALASTKNSRLCSTASWLSSSLEESFSMSKMYINFLMKMHDRTNKLADNKQTLHVSLHFWGQHDSNFCITIVQCTVIPAVTQHHTVHVPSSNISRQQQLIGALRVYKHKKVVVNSQHLLLEIKLFILINL
jgi:hypothetical protein